MGVHYSLFVSTLRSQASDEQLGLWLEKAMRLQLVGCYAQTELGHGSNVRGIQTTATWNGDEFIVDTPTLSSMKFWPTGLVSSTHCVLYAQLIVKGKDLGVHVFFVQLRGEDYEPLPGVEMGDVGSKVGDQQADIGYLRLNKIRIPLSHLLARRQRVERDGTYVKVSGGGLGSKAAYLTMLQTRSSIVSAAANVLSEGATISIRYSAVRKQGFKEPSGSDTTFHSEENSILDYAIQRHRLLKHLSRSVVMKVTGTRMREFTTQKMTDENINELHAISSILKAYTTTLTSAGLEECRKCAGGHAYLLSSGIGELETYWKGPFETAEGDPVVLALSGARFIMKKYQAARAGEDPNSELASILSRLKDPGFNPSKHGRSAFSTPEAIQAGDLDALLSMFEYRSLVCISQTGESFESSLKRLGSFDRAWSENMRALHASSTVQGIYFMLKMAVDWVRTPLVTDDEASALVLEKLIAYFALCDMQEGFQWTGLLSVDDARAVERAIDALSGALRNEMVSVCDAFDISDNTLNSTLGRYDGNVYEAIYESAVKSPLNMNKDGSRITVPTYFKALEPFLDRKFLAKHTTRVAGGEQSKL